MICLIVFEYQQQQSNSLAREFNSMQKSWLAWKRIQQHLTKFNSIQQTSIAFTSAKVFLVFTCTFDLSWMLLNAIVRYWTLMNATELFCKLLVAITLYLAVPLNHRLIQCSHFKSRYQNLSYRSVKHTPDSCNIVTWWRLDKQTSSVVVRAP